MLADLGCGIGADALAAARAGIRVRAVDADPVTAEVARANVEALGFGSVVEVVCGDAREVDLSGVDAVFCDPARRRGGGRVFDPRGYSPPWEFVAGLAKRPVEPRTIGWAREDEGVVALGDPRELGDGRTPEIVEGGNRPVSSAPISFSGTRIFGIRTRTRRISESSARSARP